MNRKSYLDQSVEKISSESNQIQTSRLGKSIFKNENFRASINYLSIYRSIKLNHLERKTFISWIDRRRKKYLLFLIPFIRSNEHPRYDNQRTVVSANLSFDKVIDSSQNSLMICDEIYKLQRELVSHLICCFSLSTFIEI